jgi:hypothetical protein
MELGPRFVQLQSIAAGLLHPLPDFGLDRIAPVGRSEQPQHRFAIRHDNVVVARRLRLDQPLDIVVVAFERELTLAAMLNSRLPRRQHFEHAS